MPLFPLVFRRGTCGDVKIYTMERIVLEVDDNVAKAWRTASIKLKQEIGGLVNKQIATIIDKKEETDILQFLSELRQEMAEKGLTQEILDDILKDEK
jgi:hypothetical protein